MTTENDLLEFVMSWTSGLSKIQASYEKNKDFKECTYQFIDKHYLFNQESVLFKPTLTNKVIFRNSTEDALSYFIGGKYSEDSGFALKQFETLKLKETHTIIEKDLLAIMGILFIKLKNSDEIIKVAFTFILKPTESGLKIKIHHSSLII